MYASRRCFGEYNSLDDYYLQGYFTNKQLRKQLRRAGLMNRDGAPVPEPIYRTNVIRSERRRRAKEELTKCLVAESINLQRQYENEIKSRLDEISKLERVRKLRLETRPINHKTQQRVKKQDLKYYLTNLDKSELKRPHTVFECQQGNHAEKIQTEGDDTIDPSEHIKTLMTMQFLGDSKDITEAGDEGQKEIYVEQMIYRQKPLWVYLGQHKPLDFFKFTTYRHPTFPFCLNMYVNGMLHLRIHTCCEYKFPIGTRLGGASGKFVLLDVQGDFTCGRCQCETNKSLIPKMGSSEERVSGQEQNQNQEYILTEEDACTCQECIHSDAKAECKCACVQDSEVSSQPCKCSEDQSVPSEQCTCESQGQNEKSEQSSSIQQKGSTKCCKCAASDAEICDEESCTSVAYTMGTDKQDISSQEGGPYVEILEGHPCANQTVRCCKIISGGEETKAVDKGDDRCKCSQEDQEVEESLADDEKQPETDDPITGKIKYGDYMLEIKRGNEQQSEKPNSPTEKPNAPSEKPNAPSDKASHGSSVRGDCYEVEPENLAQCCPNCTQMKKSGSNNGGSVVHIIEKPIQMNITIESCCNKKEQCSKQMVLPAHAEKSPSDICNVVVCCDDSKTQLELETDENADLKEGKTVEAAEPAELPLSFEHSRTDMSTRGTQTPIEAPSPVESSLPYDEPTAQVESEPPVKTSSSVVSSTVESAFSFVSPSDDSAVGSSHPVDSPPIMSPPLKSPRAESPILRVSSPIDPPLVLFPGFESPPRVESPLSVEPTPPCRSPVLVESPPRDMSPVSFPFDIPLIMTPCDLSPIVGSLLPVPPTPSQSPVNSPSPGLVESPPPGEPAPLVEPAPPFEPALPVLSPVLEQVEKPEPIIPISIATETSEEASAKPLKEKLEIEKEDAGTDPVAKIDVSTQLQADTFKFDKCTETTFHDFEEEDSLSVITSYENSVLFKHKTMMS